MQKKKLLKNNYTTMYRYMFKTIDIKLTGWRAVKINESYNYVRTKDNHQIKITTWNDMIIGIR